MAKANDTTKANQVGQAMRDRLRRYWENPDWEAQENLRTMTPAELFDAWLNWEGIIGYTDLIIERLRESGFYVAEDKPMTAANETQAFYGGNAIEDRERFVENLGWLLAQTREGVTGCELVNAEQEGEHVLITYQGGHKRPVNVHMDSYAAIVRDVAKRVS